MIRRIGLYGEPGCGKTVTALHLTSELKKAGLTIEYTNEYIKTRAIQKRLPQSFDQFYILAKQIHYEDRILPFIDYVITDSPILLNAAYSKKYKCPYWEQCIEVSLQFEDKFPGLHLFLDRKDLLFEQVGRYEDLAQSIEMDDMIKDLLAEYHIPFTIVKSTDFAKILSIVRNRLDV